MNHSLTNPAFWVYMAVSSLCIAIVVFWLLIRACNALTRPDDAMAGLLRLGYHMIYLAQSGQIAISHFRYAREVNKSKLEEAVKTPEWIVEVN